MGFNIIYKASEDCICRSGALGVQHHLCKSSDQTLKMDLQWVFLLLLLLPCICLLCSSHSLCFSLPRSPGNSTSKFLRILSARTKIPADPNPPNSPPPPAHLPPLRAPKPPAPPPIHSLPSSRPADAMASTGSPPPPCSRGDPHRRPAIQAIPTAAMPARRPPSPLCPTGDPYRCALLRAIPTTTMLLPRSSPPPPPREIPAADLPSGKMRFSPEKWEGYYFFEDAEGYLFQEADGGFYFLECFEGEGYYYQSEESDYFHTGQSLYDKDYGLQTLDSELQALSLHSDLGERGQLLEERCKGSKVREDDCCDGGSPCLKVLEASGVSGHRHIARREPKKGV